MHANNVLYHHSCYKEYTCSQQLELLSRKIFAQEEVRPLHTDEDDEVLTGNRKKAYDGAFTELADSIEKNIDKNPNCIMTLSSLWRKFSEQLHSREVEAEQYCGNLLKARFVEHFGERLTFHRPYNRSMSQYIFFQVVLILSH